MAIQQDERRRGADNLLPPPDSKFPNTSLRDTIVVTAFIIAMVVLLCMFSRPAVNSSANPSVRDKLNIPPGGPMLPNQQLQPSIKSSGIEQEQDTFAGKVLPK